MTDDITSSLQRFEDLQQGQIIQLGVTKVTREMIISFATEFDPFPFHLDEEAAKQSLLGGLAASGWQTAGLCLKLLVDAFLSKVDSRGGLGFSDLKWRRPVMVNDSITGQVVLSDLRRSGSNPEWAIMTLEFDIRNQRDEPVMTMSLANLVGVRNPEAEDPT